MLPYFTLFAAPALLSFIGKRLTAGSQRALFFIFGIYLTGLIGFRDVIGCDWYAYLSVYDQMYGRSIFDKLAGKDLGYSLLNLFAYQMDLSIYAVNLACGAIFSIGLLRFCSLQANPWLAVTIAVPYLVIVVAMGYTRQATAVGLFMLALSALFTHQPKKFFIWQLFAALFHKSAIVFLILAPLMRQNKGRNAMIIIAVGLGALLGSFTLLASADQQFGIYIERASGNEGGGPRSAINALAAVVFLVFRRPWLRNFDDFKIHLFLAILALAALPLVVAAPVAADRMSLYLLPFQISVFSRLPHFVGRSIFHGPALAGVVASYTLLLTTWLLYASHRDCWVPYQSILF